MKGYTETERNRTVIPVKVIPDIPSEIVPVFDEAYRRNEISASNEWIFPDVNGLSDMRFRASGMQEALENASLLAGAFGVEKVVFYISDSIFPKMKVGAKPGVLEDIDFIKTMKSESEIKIDESILNIEVSSDW